MQSEPVANDVAIYTLQMNFRLTIECGSLYVLAKMILTISF